MSGAAVRPQYMQGATGGGGGGDFPSLQRQQDHHSQSSFNPYSYNVPPDGSINFHGGSLASYQQQQHQPSLMQAPPSVSPPFPMESSDSNQTSSSMQSNGNSDNSLPHSDDSAHGLNGMKLESVPPQDPSQHRGASADAFGASAPSSVPQSNGIALHSSDPFTQNANGSINGFSALLGGGIHSQDVPDDSQDFRTELDLSIPQDGSYFAQGGQQQNDGQLASTQSQNHRQQLPNGPSSVPLTHSEHFEQAQVSMPHRNTVSGAHAPFAVGNLASNFLFTNGGQPSSMNGAVSSWPQAPNAPSSAPNVSSLMPPHQFNMAAYRPVQGVSPSSSPMGQPIPQQNGQQNQQQQLYLQQHQHLFQQGQGQQNFQHHQSFPGTMVPLPSGLSAGVAGATMGHEQTFPFPPAWRSNGQEASNGGFHNQQPTMNAPPNASSQQPSTAGGHGRGPAVGRPAGGRSVVHMNGPHPAKHKQKRPRRAHALIQRDYPCDWIVDGEQCTKAYGTLNHLNSHRKLKGHGQKKTSDDFREVTELRKARKKELGEPKRRPNGRGEGGAVAGPSGTQQQRQQHQQQPAHHQHPHLQQLQLHLNNTRQASQSQFPSNPQQQQEAWQRNQDRMAGQQMGMRLQNDPGSDEDGDGSPDVIPSDEWVTDSNRQSADQSPEQGMASGMVGGFAPLTQQHLASSSSATYQPDVRHWSESVPNQSPPPSPPARASFMYSSSSSEMSGNASEEESLPISARQTRSKANRATGGHGTATRGRRRGA